MSYYKKPILLTFLGVPGSGKSYFARRAATKLQAIRLSSDVMRHSIFGPREVTDDIYQNGDNTILNTYVDGAIEYAAEQILALGNDFVYDAHNNKRADRRKLEELATINGAVPILIWIKTPVEVALQRGQERPETIDQRKLSKEDMTEVIEKHSADMDLPANNEIVIEIDGQLDFNSQFRIFDEKINEIMVSE